MTSQTADAGRGRNKAPACAECGTQPSPGQSFCDGCGAVLGWTPSTGDAYGADNAYGAGSGHGAGAGAGHDAGAGADRGAGAGHDADDDTPVHGIAVIDPATGFVDPDAAATVPTPAVPPPSAVPPTPTTLPPPPVAAAPPYPGVMPSPPAAAPAAPAVPPAEAPPAAPWEPFGGGAWGPSAEERAEERARALLVPVTDPEQAATPSVAPVLPGRPVSSRPRVHGPQEQGDEDGARCPWCGTGNRPDRHFCRRCAMPMAGRPEDPVRLPWWRRLPGLGVRRVPWAGERPRLRRGLSRVLGWLAAAVALALLVTAAFQIGPAVQSVRDHFSKRAPVSPDSYRASRSFAGHGPGLAFDKFNNTWWGPGLNQSATGEWIEADFSQPVDLLDVVITSGESTLPGDLAKSALPHTIEAVVTTADGRTRNRLLTLDQAGGGQSRALRFSGVSSVRFVLQSAYGASADKQVAVAEIEFFGPSSGGGS
ncbi:NADase-type glycan-binding domain-containing protein [Streptacidiphilus cavernicola]|uniref:Zinc ribbon domain-containing protein n=1 Tax=Streptacidiphilus cavernicola TaxID=3342716 RepID=A0ABV6VWS1_9ACTN